MVQEAALGRDALVLWAGKEMQWNSLLLVNKWLTARAIHLMPPMTRWGVSKVHTQMFSFKRWGVASKLSYVRGTDTIQLMSILCLLHCMRQMHESNPKDRIYAMMAMPTSGWGMHALQPDYRKETPYLDVYRDFGFAYLEMKSELDLLTFVVHEEDELSSSPFPSWVPRWDCGADATRFFRTQYQKISNDDDDDGAVLIRDVSVLRIRGVIVDSVEHVSRETKDYSQCPAAAEEVVQLWRQVAPQSTKYPGQHQSRLSIAFLAVICRNIYTGDLDEFTRAEQAFAQLLQSDQQHCPWIAMHKTGLHNESQIMQ